VYLENKEKKHNPAIESKDSVLVITSRLGLKVVPTLSRTYKE
jgi:hypothetical protein